MDTKLGFKNTRIEESPECIHQKCYAATQTICFTEEGMLSVCMYVCMYVDRGRH